MNKTFTGRMIALTLLLILLIPPLACNDGVGSGLVLTAESGGGLLYTFGNGYYRVVVVSGDWQGMGRQYGALLADALRSFHNEITDDLESRGVSRSDMVAAAREYEKVYFPTTCGCCSTAWPRHRASAGTRSGCLTSA